MSSTTTIDSSRVFACAHRCQPGGGSTPGPNLSTADALGETLRSRGPCRRFMSTESVSATQAGVLVALALACAGADAAGSGGASGAPVSAAVSSTAGQAGAPGSGAPEPASSPTTATLPFEGTLILDEFEWTTDSYQGVIQVDLPSGGVRRFLAGREGSRSPSSSHTVFVQGCGDRVGRVVMVDERGSQIRVLTPCSSELDNPGLSPTDFGNPALSPDETRVALEARYYANTPGGDLALHSLVVVYDAEGNALGSVAGWDPAWTPDQRLVFGAPDGLYLTDETLARAVLVDGGQLMGEVFGPKVHPSGERVVFEYNQRIWQINLDGSGLEEVAFGSARLFSPAYSPDGSAIAFLGRESEYDTLIFLKNLAGADYHFLDIRSQLSSGSVPLGPLSWTP